MGYWLITEHNYPTQHYKAVSTLARRCVKSVDGRMARATCRKWRFLQGNSLKTFTLTRSKQHQSIDDFILTSDETPDSVVDASCGPKITYCWVVINFTDHRLLSSRSHHDRRWFWKWLMLFGKQNMQKAIQKVRIPKTIEYWQHIMMTQEINLCSSILLKLTRSLLSYPSGKNDF